MFNPVQVTSFLRSATQIIGTLLVVLGYVKPEDMSILGDQVVIAGGALAVITTTAYSVYAQRNAGLVKRAELVPEVAKIVVTSPAIADVTGPKVVAQ